MGNGADLDMAAQAQYARDTDAAIFDKILDEIKSSVIFQYNWEDLLQICPVVLSATGLCYAACCGETARSTRLSPPASSQSRGLDVSYLSQAISVCGNLGALAFSDAEKRMVLVNDQSKQALQAITKTLKRIAETDDLRSTSKALEDSTKNLKSYAELSRTNMEEADKNFDKWLLYTTELYATCIGTQSSDSEKLRAVSISLAVEQSRFDPQRFTTADAAAASEKLGKQIDAISQSFKKASDSFPPESDKLSQQIVIALADSAGTALTQLMTAYMLNINPTAKAATGAGMFSDLVYPRKDGTGFNQASVTQPQPSLQSIVPTSSQDPAYSIVQKDMPYLNALYVLLTSGKNGGVNWDEVRGSGGKNVNFIQRMLRDAGDAFAKLANPDGQPSKDLQSILATCTEICAGIVSEATKSTSSNDNLPQADSAKIKDWQQRFQAAYTQAQTMAALAKALPGGSAAGIPVVAGGAQLRRPNTRNDDNSAQAQAALEAARNRSSTTRDCLATTQQLYTSNINLLTQQQSSLSAFQADLKRLNTTKFGLEEIKTLLESCIKLIINMKIAIMNLVTLFRSVAAFTEDVVKFNLNPFTEQTAAITSGSGYTKTIGSYALTDVQKSIVYLSFLMIHSHISLANGTAGTWVELSMQYIRPGTQFLDRLENTDNDLSQRRNLVRTLQTWTDAAIGQLQKLAAERQQSVLERMKSRVENVEQTTSRIPASRTMLTAIQAGTKEIRETATKVMAANANAKAFLALSGSSR